jgi:hypothetical protein
MPFRLFCVMGVSEQIGKDKIKTKKVQKYEKTDW